MDELAQLLFKLGVILNGPELLQAHKELDIDGDGDIHFEEFWAYWTSDIHRSRYKVTALAKLKGRLGTAGGATPLKLSKNFNKHRGNINAQFEIGDYAQEGSTEMNLAVAPGSKVDFEKVTKDAITPDNMGEWMCHPAKIASDLWLSYKTHAKMLDDSYLAMGTVRFDVIPGKEAVLKSVIERIKTKHLNLLSMALACEGVPMPGQEAYDVLKEVDIARQEDEQQWSRDATRRFREQCHRLGKHMRVEKNEEDMLVAEEGVVGLSENSLDANVLRTLQWICEIDEEYMFEAVKFEVVGKELVVKILWVIERPMVNAIRLGLQEKVEVNVEEYLKGAIGEACCASVGIGGDISNHMKRIYEDDAAWLDMLGWGVKAKVKAEFGSSLIEVITRGAELGFVVGGPLASGVFKNLSTRIAIRNPYTRIQEIIDYLTEDARVTFVGYTGGHAGEDQYTWDEEADKQLMDVKAWAEFFHETVRDRLRISNPKASGLALQAVELLQSLKGEESGSGGDAFDPWKLAQETKASVAGFKEATVHTQYVIPTLSGSGSLRVFDLLPDDAFVERAKAGTLKKGIDDVTHKKFKAKWDEMKSFQSSDVLVQRFGKLIDAIEHVERDLDGKGKEGGKDGVLFVKSIVAALEEQTFLSYEPLDLVKKALGQFSKLSG
eukprot:TRINITY_DN32343_c0_g1_i1.p1 TRINITY_DN32343_c0_g1~~TRINITY_DN32343_c0_g1_i1.p1  ORF type:complete len:764 (+),score=339.68 TRINITY_DN32343_c0_g1_i1:304-2292(+)